MPSSPRLTPLPLDLTDITAGLFSLSVELQPLRTADEVAALLLALRRYPRDLPHRDEKIVHALGEKYNSAQLKDLIGRLDAASPAFMQLSSSLPFDGGAKIYLVCPVDNCVACAHAPPLVVKTRTVPSSPTVVTESGLLQGVVHQKVCGCCGATHGLSYAEGGVAIPAGKQLPYAHATARSTRFVHLQKGYVFDNLLLMVPSAAADGRVVWRRLRARLGAVLETFVLWFAWLLCKENRKIERRIIPRPITTTPPMMPTRAHTN